MSMSLRGESESARAIVGMLTYDASMMACGARQKKA